MKNIILSSIACAFLFTACNQQNKKEDTTNLGTTQNSSSLYACSMHPEITGKKGEACSKCGMELTEPVTATPKNETKPATPVATKVETKPVVLSSFNIDEVVNDYLKIKNALVKDDSKGAANASKLVVIAINDLNANALDTKLKTIYNDFAKEAKIQAEQIVLSADKIESQRTHFAILSQSINNLLNTFGTKQKLFQDYCPMYDQGKSGYWISEMKEIKNPYYGSEMLTCGGMVKAIQ